MVNKERSSFNLVEKVRQKRSRIKRFVRGFPRSATWIGAKNNGKAGRNCERSGSDSLYRTDPER